MGDVHEVRLPTYINVSKKTRKALNLNIYRNLHHHHLNKQKQNFHDEVKPLLGNIPRAEKIWIHYTIFAPRNGRLDTMNVGSIVDKYFSDTLVETKKIMDDHFGHVVLVSFSFGGVVKLDGHAIAKIHILEQEESNMRILLDQDDIQTALEAHVETLGIAGASGVELSVEDGTIVAEVTMGDAKAAPKKTTRKAPVKRTVKAPAKKETPNAEDSAATSSDGSDSGTGEPPKSDTPTGDEAKVETKEKGNLFGDEDSQSSESDAKADGAKAPEDKGSPATKVTKKSSIFDVD